MEKRHIKKVVEDENSVHIIYGKSEDWEGIMVDGEKRNYHEEEKDMHDKDEERKKIGTLITDGLELPLFETEEEAKEEAEKLGGDPPMCHEHTVDGETYYMPFKDHEEAKEVLNNRSMHIFVCLRCFRFGDKIESDDLIGEPPASDVYNAYPVFVFVGSCCLLCCEVFI